MSKLLPILRFLTALATILLLCTLAGHCLDLYLNEANAAFESAFTYEEAAHRLQGLTLPFILYLLLIVVTGIISIRFPAKKPGAKKVHLHSKAYSAALLPARRSRLLRRLILLSALLLILWGAWNGSLYDVLVKSINICTECIGLG